MGSDYVNGSAEWRERKESILFLSLYFIPQQSWRGNVCSSSAQGYPWVGMVWEVFATLCLQSSPAPPVSLRPKNKKGSNLLKSEM